ncbi:signal peptidase I [Salinarchaeum sp. IM2453]|uniref:signal peptidase I n=1 Tax=Salinarchaeum sp. IM2453 TaxID=2862870 RepID=UPI001C834010|nr:signal peptidase I [Salinarchaeum sp. IM2453]QZA88521.1 signal peptidase I [Salinarchaeum sp. IM2453]
MAHSITQILSKIGLILLLVIVGILLVGYAFNQPLLFAHIETDSMEPTIEPGEVVVVAPPELTGDPDVGDVIVFDAEYTDGGGLVTHRVVGEESQGYITQGDANLVTDQDSGEAPITDGQVEAVLLSTGGSVITIPYLGTAAEGIQSTATTVQQWLSNVFGTDLFDGMEGQAIIMFTVGGIALLLGLRDSDSKRSRDRSRSRNRAGYIPASSLLIGFVVLLISAALLGMLLPAGTTTYEVLSSESESGPPHTIEAGGSDTVNFTVGNEGLIPTHVYLEPASDGIAIEDDQFRLGHNELDNATVTRSAPPETGLYYRSVEEYRYYALLPGPVIDWLYQYHPWLPLAGISAVIGGVAYGVGRALLGSRNAVRLRSRSRTRDRYE